MSIIYLFWVCCSLIFLKKNSIVFKMLLTKFKDNKNNTKQSTGEHNFVCGEPMLVAFVVNPCPLIYIPKNVYTCSNICLMFIKIIPTYYQQNYVPTSQQACSRSYLRTMVCPKYILGYVLVLSLFLEALLKFRNRHNFVLTLGHHLPCPKTILRL